MIIEKIRWMRELSCGHERPTNIAFIHKKYDKPQIGDECYCRICWDNVKIIGVRNLNQTGSEQ